MLLHTSGTSGNKKLVPYSLEMIIIGCSSIISSWNLKPNDICLNMMPLFHIGGIMRNILSPIMSGGHIICCNGFDPILFWDILYGNRDSNNESTENKKSKFLLIIIVDLLRNYETFTVKSLTFLFFYLLFELSINFSL